MSKAYSVHQSYFASCIYCSFHENKFESINFGGHNLIKCWCIAKVVCVCVCVCKNHWCRGLLCFVSFISISNITMNIISLQCLWLWQELLTRFHFYLFNIVIFFFEESKMIFFPEFFLISVNSIVWNWFIAKIILIS